MDDCNCTCSGCNRDPYARHCGDSASGCNKRRGSSRSIANRLLIIAIFLGVFLLL